jgi:hypothetical protein
VCVKERGQKEAWGEGRERRTSPYGDVGSPRSIADA